jgi:mRNA-degrading endonuclease RelE of RelBE toxin-antitoxin system
MQGVKPIKTERGVYRLRIGDLRLLFGLNKKGKIIEVFAIVPRSDAYKKK